MLLLGMANYHRFATFAPHSNLRSSVCQKSLDRTLARIFDYHSRHLLHRADLFELWAQGWSFCGRKLVPVLISLPEAIFQNELLCPRYNCSLLVYENPSIQTHP